MKERKTKPIGDKLSKAGTLSLCNPANAREAGP